MPKFLITSPDALINKETNTWFSHIEDSLRHFLAREKGNQMVFISKSQEKLATIPAEFNPLKVHPSLRGSPKLIDVIIKAFPDIGIQDILELGATDADSFTAFNAKALLLAAAYAKVNNPKSRIHTPNYGIKLDLHPN